MITAAIFIYGIIDDSVHFGVDGYDAWFDGCSIDTGAMVALLTIDLALLFWIDKIFF